MENKRFVNDQLGFKRFLLEMETTADEKQRIREIIEHLVAGDKQWLDEKEIIVGNKTGYWMLNYRQGPSNEYNKLVRGMVIQRPSIGWSGDPLSLVKSFPFIRFRNAGEKEADPVDLSNSEMLEKLDGSMVAVFFPEGDTTKPQYHTRKMLSVDPQDREKTLTSFVGKNYKFMNIIGQYVNGLKFLPQDAEYTYIFEFIHEASYVLTKYTPEQFGLYLIGGRHVPSHKELSEQELDEVALRIGARRPRRWDSKANYAEIEKMMRELSAATKDFEGFVFRDKATGKRLKVKDAEYVRRHHMLDDARSIKSLLPIILQGEEDELLAYYPHAAERAVEIKQAYAEYIDKVVGRIKEWQAKGLDRQALAYAVFGHNTLSKWELKSMKAKGEELPKVIPGEPDEFIREMTMKHYKVQDENVLRQIIDNTLSGIALGQGKNAGNPKKLMDIIGLRDKEEVTPDLGEI